MNSPPRSVVVVVFDGLVLLDLAGPIDVLNTAPAVGGDAYHVVLASPDGAPVRTDSGIQVTVDASLEAVAEASIDTLIVAGGRGVHRFAADPVAMTALRVLSGRARRTASICTGAFALAAAGLLADRRATTHWGWSRRLADEHPQVTVESDRIFVRDADVWTSAGVTAGIDLTLALLEQDQGVEISHAVAAGLVVYARRPGGQDQFSSQLLHQAGSSSAVAEIQRWIAAHLQERLTVEVLAEQAGMSARTFTRTFRRETGTTPGAYVEMVRVEAAQNLLATTDLTLPVIARRVGLAGPEVLHRSFRRRTETTPGRYRDHFSRLDAS